MERAHRSESSQNTITLDVLVIGGGVQGLWLLNDLSKVGYDTILIEKDKVGGIQTIHSHGYLHQGYLYNDEQMARRLKGAEERWTTFCKNHNLEAPGVDSYFGFASHANAALWKSQWEKAGLHPDELQVLLPFMQNGLLRRVFATKETWLDTKQMTSCLANHNHPPVKKFIYQGEVTKFVYDLRRSRINAVEVTIDNKPFILQPRFVIFAAGEGNAALLELLRSTNIDTRVGVMAHLRQSQMLVIKGSNDLLRQLALVVPDLSLFIVSREDEDGRIVWLVSYDVDEEYEAELERPSPDVPRIQATVVTICAILPEIFSDEKMKRMEWGSYTGVKAEAAKDGRVLPNEWTVETFGAANLYVVWPTKMTLAPEASEKIVFKLLDSIPYSPKDFEPEAHGLPPATNWAIGEEMWKTLDLCVWDDFKDMNKIKL